MSKYLQIQIPKTCEENWDDMQVQQHGKFCGSCQKTVIDFTGMTDKQLIEFFKKSKDNVCGRFTSDQLDTEIEIPAKRIPWLKYFFQVAIPAFLFTSKTVAQGNARVHQSTYTTPAKKGHSKILKRVFGITTNDVLKTKEELILKSRAEEIDEYIYPKSLNRELRIITFTAGGVSVFFSRKIKEPSIKQPSSIISTLTIFPNPISSSSKLNIKWSSPVSADQIIEIFNQQGSLIQKEVIRIKKSSSQEGIDLKQLTPGTYIIKVTDSKTRKSSSQQFIVQ